MAEQVELVVEAVEDLSRKWHGASTEMADAAYRANMLKLEKSAFWIGLPSDVAAGIRWDSYNDFQEYLVKLLNGGAVEFEQLGAALQRLATHFDRTDQTSAADLDKIFGKLPTDTPA